MQSRKREIKVSPLVDKTEFRCREAKVLKFIGKSIGVKKIALGRRAPEICSGFLQSFWLSADWCRCMMRLSKMGKILSERVLGNNSPGPGIVVLISQSSLLPRLSEFIWKILKTRLEGIRIFSDNYIIEQSLEVFKESLTSKIIMYKKKQKNIIMMRRSNQ